MTPVKYRLKKVNKERKNNNPMTLALSEGAIDYSILP